MPITPLMESEALDEETEAILADPEVQQALAELDDPEDREDFVDHLKVMRRARAGTEAWISWEDEKAELGLQGIETIQSLG